MMTFKTLLLSLSALGIYGYLVMVGCGSYTQLFDPNREPPEPIPEIITPIKDDAIPQSRRDYYAVHFGLARDRNPYNNSWSRYTGYVYQPYHPERYIYVDSRATPQSYAPQQTVAPVTPSVQPAPVDAARAAIVWKKRISPRVREAPTPTKKGEK